MVGACPEPRRAQVGEFVRGGGAFAHGEALHAGENALLHAFIYTQCQYTQCQSQLITPDCASLSPSNTTLASTQSDL